MEKKGQRTGPELTIRMITFMFYRENQIRRAVKEARNDHGGHTGGSCGHAYVSDPTASQGIRMAEEIPSVVLDDGSEIRRPERWLAVIEATYSKQEELNRKALRMRYNGEHWRTICDACHMSHDVYYTVLRESQQFAIAAACQQDLIKVM
jgi:hypothetical protein